MKGFLVVDRLNDIHFIDTDKEFARHINEQAREFGLLNVSTVEFNQNPLILYNIRIFEFWLIHVYIHKV